MKRWKFSLEAVRNLKATLEDKAGRNHAEALVRLGQARAKLAEIEQAMESAGNVAVSTGARILATEELHRRQYVAFLDQERKERHRLCQEAEKAVVLAREHLEKTAREHEILENLRDRKKAEHDFHVGRQEQKWLDELAQHMKGRAPRLST